MLTVATVDGLIQEKPKKVPAKRTWANTTASTETQAKRGQKPTTDDSAHIDDDTLPAVSEIGKGIPPRNPLPDRAKRAEKEKKQREALKQKIDKLIKEKKQMLAHMEIELEAEECRDAAASVSLLTDVPVLFLEDPENEDEEFFAMDDDQDMLFENKHTKSLAPAKKESTESPLQDTHSKATGKQLTTAPLGGLTDTDIKDSAGLIQLGTTVDKLGWANDLVILDSDNSDLEPEIIAQVKQESNVQTPTARKTGGRLPTTVKRENSSFSETISTPITVSSPVMFASTDQMTDLIRLDWAPRFIPTLYHTLLTSRKPFDDFSGSKAIITLQHVANLVYPDMEPRVVVTFGSEIYQKGTDQANELWSRIGSKAIKMVQKFFKDEEYQDKPSEIIRYVNWALRPDGPAFYWVPGSEILIKNSAGQLVSSSPPEDPFQSEFIVKLVTPVLKYTRASCGAHVFGEPEAAFVLAATAIKHTFSLYKTGTYVAPTTNFSGNLYQGTVTEYLENFEKFSDHRWKALKEACGMTDLRPNAAPSSAALRGKWGTIYIPSSPPPKES
ncbi:hypothetical protein DXG01_002690 [Tephrocybe rancida]|nr:hypothetical protein DXG01_002690 [Tephrocybe rancida]